MRMILDCRRSILLFKRPPHVQLVTGEGLALANLEVEIDKTGDDAGLWVGQADVKDAFHRLGMPSFLSRYFGYPGCTAEEMKMVGETVDDVVYPLARSLPMGFAWSLDMPADRRLLVTTSRCAEWKRSSRAGHCDRSE